MDELGCEFIVAVVHEEDGGESIIGVSAVRCNKVDFMSVGRKLKLVGLNREKVDKVIIFELKGEELVKVGTYKM